MGIQLATSFIECWESSLKQNVGGFVNRYYLKAFEKPMTVVSVVYGWVVSSVSPLVSWTLLLWVVRNGLEGL